MSAMPHRVPQPCPRSPAEIADQWAFFNDPAENTPAQRDYTRGVLESLRWIMGRRPEAPVTEKALGHVPTLDDIEWEATCADNGVRAFGEDGVTFRRRHDFRYLQGCEAALFWATGEGGETIY